MDIPKSISLLLGVCVVASPLLAWGQTVPKVPPVRTMLGQPGYIPEAGQAISETGYSYATSSHENLGALGEATGSVSGHSDSETETLVYGVTDHLSINLHASYQQSSATTDRTTGVVTATNSVGFTDPSLGATWRVVDQGAHPFSIDLSGTYAPNLIRAKSATATQSGSTALGGTETTLTAAATRLAGSNIFYGSVSANYFSSRTNLIQSGPYDRVAADQWRYGATLGYDRILTPKLDASLALRLAPAYQTDETNLGGSGSVYTVKSDAQTSLTAGVNAALIPNRVALSFTYAHVFDYGSQTETSGAPAPSSATHHSVSDTLGVTLRFRFT